MEIFKIVLCFVLLHREGINIVPLDWVSLCYNCCCPFICNWLWAHQILELFRASVYEYILVESHPWQIVDISPSLPHLSRGEVTHISFLNHASYLTVSAFNYSHAIHMLNTVLGFAALSEVIFCYFCICSLSKQKVTPRLSSQLFNCSIKTCWSECL